MSTPSTNYTTGADACDGALANSSATSADVTGGTNIKPAIAFAVYAKMRITGAYHCIEGTLRFFGNYEDADKYAQAIRDNEMLYVPTVKQLKHKYCPRGEITPASSVWGLFPICLGPDVKTLYVDGIRFYADLSDAIKAANNYDPNMNIDACLIAKVNILDGTFPLHEDYFQMYTKPKAKRSENASNCAQIISKSSPQNTLFFKNIPRISFRRYSNRNSSASAVAHDSDCVGPLYSTPVGRSIDSPDAKTTRKRVRSYLDDFTSLPLVAPAPRVHSQGVERASAMLSAQARDPQNLHNDNGDDDTVAQTDDDDFTSLPFHPHGPPPRVLSALARDDKRAIAMVPQICQERLRALVAPQNLQTVSQTDDDDETVSQTDDDDETVSQTDDDDETVSQTDDDDETVSQTDDDEAVSQTDDDEAVSQTDDDEAVSQTDERKRCASTAALDADFKRQRLDNYGSIDETVCCIC